MTELRYFGVSEGLSLDGKTLVVQLQEGQDPAQLAPFADLVRNALLTAGMPEGVKVTYRVPVHDEVPRRGVGGVPSAETNLLASMTFSNFVEGPSNRFPLALAQYVAQTPGDDTSRTNPLFMHGPTGVGKTHLLHAIGNMALEKNPNLKVLYTTSEQLMNEYMHQWSIGAQNDNAKESFRNKYRTPDILLVDDIQYLAGKRGLQDEFFNIFNALKDARRQIVMTSDRAPTDIPDLMDRLVSRFQSGITADVDVPAYETRMNILLLKLRAYPDVNLSQEIREFIAQRVSSSVRALEGALATTVNYARMFPDNPNALTIEVLEKSLLRAYLKEEEETAKLNCADIQKAVCEHFRITMEELRGKGREKRVATPRQLAIFLCRKLTPTTMTELGTLFNRTHATIVYSLDQVQGLYRDGDQETCKALKEIMGRLGRTTGELT